jgi:CHAT domain-containing protein
MRWVLLLVACGVAWPQQAVDEGYLRAWQMVGQDRMAEAIPVLQALIAAGNRSPQVYALLGDTYRTSNSAAKGAEYFRELIRQNPGSSLPHYGLARTLYRWESLADVVTEASACAYLEPRLLECYVLVAEGVAQGAHRTSAWETLAARLPMDEEAPESLHALGLVFQIWGEPAKAVEAGEAAVRLARERGDAGLTAAVEARLANAYWMSAEPLRRLGRKHAEEACRLARTQADLDALFSNCREMVGHVSLSGDAGGPIFQELIQLARDLRNPTIEGSLECGLAGALDSEGHPAEALEHFSRAIALAAPFGGRNWADHYYRLRGELQMKLGDYEAAIESFHGGLRIADDSGDSQRRAHVLAKLTVAYTQTGNALAAIRTAEEAVQSFRGLGMLPQAGAELSDVGWAYLTLGDVTTAARYFRESLESGRRFNDSSEVVRNGNLLAEAYLESGQWREARRLLLDSLPLIPVVHNDSFEIRMRTLLGEAHSRLGEARAAVEEFERASRLVARVAGAWLEADLRERMGRHFLRTGDLESAARVFESGLAIAERASMLKQVQRAREGLAEVARRRNRPEQAVAWLKQAVEALESVRMGAPGPELRAGLMRKNWAVYEELIDLLGELHRRRPGAGYDREALTFSERGRARVLLDLLEESRAGLRLGLTAEQAARQRSLERQMTAALDRLSKENTAGARAAVEQAERALQEWATELRVTNPRYHGLKYPEPLDAEGVRRLAGERGLTIVEYSLGRRSSRVWVAARGELWSAALPAEGVVAEQVRKLRESLSEHPRGAAAEQYQAPAKELYRMLIGPVRARLGSSARVVVVPDGILHYLPFEALLGQDGRFLLEEVAVSYAPSASVLAELQRSAPGRGSREVFALGNPDFGRRGAGGRDGQAEVVRAVYGALGMQLRPLPGTEREVRSIAALYPGGQSKVLVGRGASEQALKAEALGDYRRVHLATHALIDERAPARSGIVLSLVDGSREDGVLRISEIMDLPLKAELVVLSACQTGLGTLVRGEGMVGFTRAFLYAGAERVAVSLWPVNDGATPEIMEGFYRGMRSGQAVAEALRAAKVGMMKSGVAGYRHPYFWAGFVVVGGR